jgi:hypothetical protein
VEPVRDGDPAQHVAQLVRPGGIAVAGDPQRDRRWLLAGVPGRQELAHRRVEDPFQRPPRPVEVEVDPPQRHRGDGRMAGGPVAAVDQQDPPRAREAHVRPLQRLHRVGEDQRDPVRVAHRVLAGDPVVTAEPALQVRPQGVVGAVHQQEHGSGHTWRTYRHEG